MTKAGLVLTTINDPVCLDGYYENFKKFGHLEQVKAFVIADKKTPVDASYRCTRLWAEGFDVHCIDLEEQARFVDSVGLLLDMFPLNSDNRRNIGYLMALAEGVDFVISIDDDNYCLPEHDYFGNHELILWPDAPVAFSADTKWLNPCDWLDTENHVYQRGYPYYMRTRHGGLREEAGQFTVHANQGLWWGDPDVDAMTWLVSPAASVNHSRSFIIRTDTWAPLNSQNTAVRAEAMPAYYFIPMDGTINGWKIDRFGDIFQGYFLQKCMKHLGGHLRIGTPIVEHKRNSHNYFDDAEKEFFCIRLLEEMLPWLTDECRVQGSDYCETYANLAAQLDGWVFRSKSKLVLAASGYLHRVAKYMRHWANACKTIGVGKVAA